MDRNKYSLARNKSGNWEIRWSEWDEAAGRSRSRSASCRTENKREAQAFLDIWLDIQTGVAQTEVGATVGPLLDAYLERHVKTNCNSATNDYSLRAVRNWFADKDLGDVTDAELWAYRQHREKKVSSATVRKEFSAFRAALNWAAHKKRRLIPKDAVPEFDLPPDSAPRTHVLDAGEADKLFAVASARALSGRHFFFRRGGLFTCLAMETAARETAVRTLTWDRVDLAAGLIDFRDPGLNVSNKRRVPVPVSAKLMPILEDAKARQQAEGDHSPFVLRHSGSARSAFVGLCSEAGIGRKVNIHDLRRTWATTRASWGVPLEEVAGILGDSLEVVEKHYAHFQPGFGRRAVDATGPVILSNHG